jgi:diguanylate cyclase (GGDEF)-like protein
MSPAAAPATNFEARKRIRKERTEDQPLKHLGDRTDVALVEGFSDALAGHGAWRYDLGSRATEWSDAVYRIHGVTRECFDPEPNAIAELIHPDDIDEYRAIVREAVASRAPFTVQHRIVRPDDVVRTVILRGAYMPSPGGPGVLIGTTEDVSGKSGVEERLWFLANQDSLTGLFNRRRFMDELEREVALARRSGAEGAVLMLDLDRFKEINDTLGHTAGDSLLVRVAEVLRERLRSTDMLGRLGGDEFALVLPACGIEDAETIGAELAWALSETTIRIAGRDRHVTTSIGIAPFGLLKNDSAEALLVEADLAMYRAKAAGGAAMEVFTEEIRAELGARVRTEAQLREALERGQLRVHYQPIVSLADQAPVGCEALVRWMHPERGMVAPDEFIPVAEEYGLIGRLGQWVLERACDQARRWRAMGHDLYVAVNVSPLQLAGSDVASGVARVLARTELPPELLYLEMTETALLEDASDALPALRELKELGIRLALDDFGGGSSSFELLRELPIDVIKIDRLFVSGIPHQREDRAIVAAVLSLAQELELTVIAEGVESDRQHSELRMMGCHYAQGFHYARPGPPDELDLGANNAAVQPRVGDPYVGSLGDWDGPLEKVAPPPAERVATPAPAPAASS